MKDNPRRTKILATLGPTSEDAVIVDQLIQAGANGFRLNFSHGTKETFLPLFDRIRTLAAQHRQSVAILQDLQGPKIRVGFLENHQPVLLEAGKNLEITTADLVGNSSIISTTYNGLAKDVREGDTILLDDGAIELKVTSVKSDHIETQIIIGGILKERKGMNLPGIAISAPSLTEKDVVDARFGADMQVDYIALSFVRTAWDVLSLKNLLLEWQHPEIKVIAKIEKPEAVKNIQEILDASDGVMVARGDLGVEMAPEKVPLIQKMIIERANKMEKLVITATQMLESMVSNLNPTRAEASDVANAILDGTDVVMLSQETAIGKHPARVVRTMASIARFTESDEEIFSYIERIRPQTITNFAYGIVHSARAASIQMKAKAIIVFTQSGMTAHLASCQRPPCPIYAFTPNETTFRQLALAWGVYPILTENLSPSEAMIDRGIQILVETRAIQSGDIVIIVSGPNPVAGATNMMKIERI